MLLVTSTVKTLLSFSWNRINQSTTNKQIDNQFNEDIINASTLLD